MLGQALRLTTCHIPHEWITNPALPFNYGIINHCSPDGAACGAIRVFMTTFFPGLRRKRLHPGYGLRGCHISYTVFSLSISYLLYIHVGKGLPTYCVTRVVRRQPLAAKDKQSNQPKLSSRNGYKPRKNWVVSFPLLVDVDVCITIARTWDNGAFPPLDSIYEWHNTFTL